MPLQGLAMAFFYIIELNELSNLPIVCYKLQMVSRVFYAAVSKKIKALIRLFICCFAMLTSKMLKIN